MKALVVGSSDIDIFLSPELPSSFVENEDTVTLNLGDKIPSKLGGMCLGGNGSNVSVSLSRLGIETSFYTYFGQDILAKQIQETLNKEKVKLIDHEQNGENSALSLIVDFKKDRVIFSHHETRDHKFDESKAQGFSAIYLTSIGEKWEEAYKSVSDFIHGNSIICAFSPGSHQLNVLDDVIYEIIAGSKILFVNKEEGEKVLDKKGESAQDIKELLTKLSKMGPEIVSVTDGKEGSYCLSDGVYYSLDSFDPESSSVDKTGAGDSYASAFFAAHLLGKDIKTSMRWGAVNANSVMQKVGAQGGLLTISDIDKILFDRPDFQPEML